MTLGGIVQETGNHIIPLRGILQNSALQYNIKRNPPNDAPQYNTNRNRTKTGHHSTLRGMEQQQDTTMQHKKESYKTGHYDTTLSRIIQKQGATI